MRYLLRVLLLLLVILPATVIFAQEPTPQSTGTPTAPSQIIVRVWWPDNIYPLDSRAGLDLLEDQIAEFNNSNDQYSVEVRLKAHEGQGSVLTTLITAQPVAPSAVPDLVLLPRGDLLTAVRAGVIRQIDSWVPDTLRADLLPNTLQLGMVDDTFYGLPYAITVEHSIAQAQNFRSDIPIKFEDLLELQQRYFLPGMPDTNQAVNDTVLAQYIEAGGRLVDVDNGNVPILDQEPLLEVLSFYESGLEEGVFATDSLGFSSPADYWSRFNQGDIPMGVVNSDLYLGEDDLASDIEYFPLPNVDGENLVILDGWVWALTASNPDQQAAALAFIEWIMGVENQANYTEAFGVIPSRQRAFRIWSNTRYVSQIEPWISEGIVLPLEQRNNLAAEQLQNAFEAVLNGTPYETAADDALSTLSISN